jgi:hypothetical protein
MNEPVDFKDKIKNSYYLESKTEQRIVEIVLHRLKQGKRTRKSYLIDEAIELLHMMEFRKENK